MKTQTYAQVTLTSKTRQKLALAKVCNKLRNEVIDLDNDK
nr:MAG TPA: hypothetical protein [Inoviridae sp.]